MKSVFPPKPPPAVFCAVLLSDSPDTVFLHQSVKTGTGMCALVEVLAEGSSATPAVLVVNPKCILLL